MTRLSPLGLLLAMALPAFTQTPAPEPVDPPLPGEAFLAKRPLLPPLKPFSAPVPKELRLANGMQVLLVARPGAPLLALQFVSRGGSLADPARLPGLASLAAAMLEAGSAGRSQTAIAAQADALGASLEVGAGPEALQVRLTALPTRFKGMVDLLADVALRPNLEPGEWDKLKARRGAELQSRSANPSLGARMAFQAALYGAGAQGRPATGTPEAIAAMRLEDVRGFLAGQTPDACTLVVVGAVTEAELLPVLEAGFGRPWEGRTPRPKLQPDPVPATHPRLATVAFPGKPQTVLLVGQPGVRGTDPDAPALALLNEVLGGSFTSRLNQNLREVHGYTYGASSSFGFGAQPGPFMVATNVKTDTTGAALAETLKELARVRQAPLSEEELTKGKALLAFNLVGTLQGAGATAALVAQNLLQGLPLDDLATRIPRLQALDAAQVQAAARRALDPDTMTILLAGDLDLALPQLPKAGLALPAPKAYTAFGAPVPPR